MSNLMLSHVDWRSILAAVGIYWASLVVYRLWFHPIASIPGPRLAAVSYIWQYYYDIVEDGSLVHQLPRLHSKYGRVVRISPNEVHINDPEVFHQIYRANTPFLKSPSFYNGFGFPTALFTLMETGPHKLRRDTLSSLFSKRAVDSLEEVIYERINMLCDRLGEMGDKGQAIPIQSAFYCTTVDVISTYCFGKSFNMLKQPGFEGEIVDNVLSFTNSLWLLVHFPIVQIFAAISPGFIGKKLAGGFMGYRTMCEKLVRDFLSSRDDPEGKRGYKRATIFDVLLDPEHNKEKTTPNFPDLVDEAMSLLTGGTDTTGESLTFSLYYFLIEREAQRKVREELDAAPRDSNGRLTLTTLQQLPYFTGFIKEVLRSAHGAPGRLPRLVPKGGMTISSTSQYLPAGTVVGVAHSVMHRNPELFDDPWIFNPERWLEGGDKDRWLCSFSRGTRGCLGTNLAWAEMYLVLGNLFSRFDMKLHDTTPRDMEWVDHAAPHPRGKLQITAKRRNQGWPTR